jgi:hypothetical protein
MQRLAQELWRHRRPELVDVTLHELAWMSTSENPGWQRRLWLEDGEVVAWGLHAPPGELEWQVELERPELLHEVLDWFEAAAEGERRTAVRSGDSEALERLCRRGYEHDPAAPWFLRTIRPLHEIEEPAVPEGFRLRTMREGVEVNARVAVHRAAREPSSFTAERYPIPRLLYESVGFRELSRQVPLVRR